MKKCLIVSTVSRQFTLFERGNIEILKELGYEIHCIANFSDATEEIDKLPIIKHNIDIQRSPFSIKNLKAYKELKKIIDEEKFELIHCHSPMGGVLTRLAAKRTRKINRTRVIYTAHGFHFFKGAPLINWMTYYIVEKGLSKFTDCIITINKEDYNLAKRKFKSKKVELVNGIGVDEKKFNFQMTNDEKHNLRNELGIKDDDFVIISIGELNKNKNQMMQIKAIEEICQKYKNIKLVLVGEGNQKQYYKKIIEKLNLQKNIYLLGYRKNIPELLKISDCLISTSFREGLPVNIIEAMCCNLPIIATNCRGNKDLIENEKNGYIVEINNFKDLTEKILKLYLNERILRNENIEKYFKENIKKEMLKIYIETNKKTIVHVLSSHNFSGAENVVCQIIDNLKDNNTLNIYYCSPDGDIKNFLQEKKIKFIPLKKLNNKYLNKMIKTFSPDIIHAHDFRASINVARTNFKGKIISHIHQTPFFLKTWNIKSIIYFLTNKRYDKIIGVSNLVFKNCIFYKYIDKKCTTIYNNNDKQKTIELSEQYEFKKQYDLLFFGRLVEVKNPLEFIEIVNEVKKQIPNIKAVMIGDGLLKKECLKKISHLQLNENIEILGFVKNPFPIIKNSKIMIMTSKWEGIPISVLEYMSLNHIVLNNGVGGLEEIFKDNDYLICKTREEYYKKTVKLLSDNKLYNETLENELKSTKKFLDIEEYIKKIKEEYKCIRE